MYLEIIFPIVVNRLLTNDKELIKFTTFAHFFKQDNAETKKYSDNRTR